MIKVILFFGSGYLLVLGFVKNAHYLALVLLSKTERIFLHNYYSRKFTFYNQLSAKNQLKFIYRVMIIRKTNRIKVDDEIKHVNHDIELMVSAAFAQITFGFTNYELRKFSKIIIYPDSFYSKLAGNHVNGLTVGNGYIYLSWNHFLKGYQSMDDKVNLALHELAHALYIDKFHYKKSIKWFEWQEQATKVYKLINANPGISFFRSYAKTNMAEFWAVSVECFFEDPVNFKRQFPELYDATVALLKQDLLALN
jgi:Mlc titration factor MtfA (ptsG expression regulator)